MVYQVSVIHHKSWSQESLGQSFLCCTFFTAAKTYSFIYTKETDNDTSYWFPSRHPCTHAYMKNWQTNWKLQFLYQSKDRSWAAVLVLVIIFTATVWLDLRPKVFISSVDCWSCCASRVGFIHDLVQLSSSIIRPSVPYSIDLAFLVHLNFYSITVQDTTRPLSNQYANLGVTFSSVFSLRFRCHCVSHDSYIRSRLSSQW